MTDFNDLLARVQAATGPDHVLDQRIHCALHSEERNWEEWKYRYGGESLGVTPVTASVDAALALVKRLLPGALRDAHAHGQDDGGWQFCLTVDKIWTGNKVAPTLPLAILAALLTACANKND